MLRNQVYYILFYKKVNQGYNKIYRYIYQSYKVDSVSSYTTSREATDMKNVIYTTSKLLFYIEGHIRKMKRMYGFKLPKTFEGIIRESESIVKV